ncbi:MAG TPA: RNA 2',3'-cyclic phosphodiesterase [Nitrospirae bacterium]|nr:RNA 2',3'-cyclic phosphodiesterase [Nitrospirota bacterium]
MRAFIAIDIGEEMKKELESFMKRLKKFDPNVKWLSGDHIHLTLKFLGNTDDTLVDRIKRSLKSVASYHGKFNLTATGTGVFPGYSRPRVLWVGIDRSEELNLLYNNTESAMELPGYKREPKKFRPHLTIARVKSQKVLTPLLKELRGCKDREFGKIEVSEVLLMKSTLKPTGAEYERLFSAPLGKED